MPLKLAYLKDLPLIMFWPVIFMPALQYGIWSREVILFIPVHLSRSPAMRRGGRERLIFYRWRSACARVLETLHYEEVNIHLDPWDGSRNPIEIVGGHLQELPAAAKAILSVKGFIDGGEKQGMGEKKLVKEIDRIAGPRCAGEIN